MPEPDNVIIFDNGGEPHRLALPPLVVNCIGHRSTHGISVGDPFKVGGMVPVRPIYTPRVGGHTDAFQTLAASSRAARELFEVLHAAFASPSTRRMMRNVKRQVERERWHRDHVLVVKGRSRLWMRRKGA